MTPLTLILLPQTFAILRLPPTDPVPAWAMSGSFTSITRTQYELSIVCEEARLPKDQPAEGNRRAFQVQGPLGFSLTGIIAGLSGTLARADVSIFAISTYDTDYVFVQEGDLEQASTALIEAGWILRKEE